MFSLNPAGNSSPSQWLERIKETLPGQRQDKGNILRASSAHRGHVQEMDQWPVTDGEAQSPCLPR